MKILILNWRCPNNPKSGGAEYVTLKHASYWAQHGHEVTWLAGRYTGAKQQEKISDVQVVRIATPVSLYFLAPLWYWLQKRQRFDIVIDQIHGLSFLTPVWAHRSRHIAFIHEVAQEIWDEMLPRPINYIGKIYERLSLQLYKKTPFWTVSPSTKKDLLKFSIPEQNITIIPNAVDDCPKNLQKKDKPAKLKLLFVGRLVPMKGVEIAIQVCAEVRKHVKDVSLNVVGDGEETYKSYLKNLVSRLQLREQVHFLGRLSEEDKITEYQTAHFLLHFSVREGFGLVVLEANQQGTPVIANDAPGLRDIVVSGKNGYLVPLNNIRAASGIIIKQFQDASAYFELSKRSKEFAVQYQWSSVLPLSLTLLMRVCNLIPRGDRAEYSITRVRNL